MGKKKKVTSGKRKKAKQDAYVQAIVVIIFSIIFAILIYGQTGSLGRGLSAMLGGLFGWVKYIIPIGTFTVGIVLTKEPKELVIPKIIQFVVILLCVCGLMSLIQISSKDLDPAGEFGSLVSVAYNKGELNKGGGACRSISCSSIAKDNRGCLLCSFTWYRYTSYNIHLWN